MYDFRPGLVCCLCGSLRPECIIEVLVCNAQIFLGTVPIIYGILGFDQLGYKDAAVVAAASATPASSAFRVPICRCSLAMVYREVLFSLCQPTCTCAREYIRQKFQDNILLEICVLVS